MNDHEKCSAPNDDPADASNDMTQRLGSLFDTGSAEDILGNDFVPDTFERRIDEPQNNQSDYQNFENVQQAEQKAI
jgi:hypothetical protein